MPRRRGWLSSLVRVTSRCPGAARAVRRSSSVDLDPHVLWIAGHTLVAGAGNLLAGGRGSGVQVKERGGW
ncbi:MAG: hypothetical protein M3R02_21355 [Chloroflexota bacterium]|nr:hypothetical protein [Chloroflexota bacterium]